MNKIWQLVKKEILEVMPAVIYFMITFNLTHLISGLILEGSDIKRYYSYLGVTLEALVVGKVIIIANAMPFINLFPHKPLVYNILWKFFIYGIFVFVFWSAEYAIHLYFDFGMWGIVWQHLSYIYSLTRFWAGELLVMFLLLVFVIFHEIISAVGRKNIYKLMFIDSRP